MCVCLWMCVFRYTMIQVPSHIPSIVISHIRSYHSLYIRIQLFSYSLNIGIVIDIHMPLYTHFKILPNHLEQSCIYIHKYLDIYIYIHISFIFIHMYVYIYIFVFHISYIYSCIHISYK